VRIIGKDDMKIVVLIALVIMIMYIIVHKIW